MQWDCVKNQINLLLNFCSDKLHLVAFSSEVIVYCISIILVRRLLFCVVSYPPACILFCPFCAPNPEGVKSVFRLVEAVMGGDALVGVAHRQQNI